MKEKMKCLLCISMISLTLSSFVFSISVLQESMNSKDVLQNSDCMCAEYDCGCCQYVDLRFVGINGIVCTNLTYLPHDYGISVTLTYNNYTLFNETVSARNPPPFCIGIPEFEKIGAEICLRLYDLSFQHNHFHGCLKVEISVYHIIHKTVTVGCFDLPSQYHCRKQKYTENEIEPSVKII